MIMAGLFDAFVCILAIMLLFGCLGAGCQNDAQCKPGESCVNGACNKDCVREYGWCESTAECCPGMECSKNACRFPYDIKDANQTPDLGVNATPSENFTGDMNSSAGNTTNFTLEYFQPGALDLAEGQTGSIGNISISVVRISEDLGGCSVENQAALLRVSGYGRTEEFTLRPGENESFLNADIKMLDIPCAVSENETSCLFGNISAFIEIGKRFESEAILEKGQRFLAPDGQSAIEARRITNLGELPEYWRSFNLSEGESLVVDYQYLGGINSLVLEIEGIDEGMNSSPAGSSCKVSSRWVKMKATAAGTEIHTAASEGGNTTVQWHKINVVNVSESLLLSDGKGCAQANKTVLLNISFPRANQNILVDMYRYKGDFVEEISASSKTPWESDGLMLEVSPIGDESGGTRTGAFRMKATGIRKGGAVLFEGEQDDLYGVFVNLESFGLQAIEKMGNCILVDIRATVKASDRSQTTRKTLADGAVMTLGDGGYVKLKSINYDLSRKIGSCRVTLERAVMAVSPLNATASKELK